jgi:hypothetical protein
MVGRPIELLARTVTRVGDRVALETRGLTHPGFYHDVSLAVRSGEVLGMAGLIGSGRSEFAQTLFGCLKPASGEIDVGGVSLRPGSVPRAVRAGLGYVPEERQSQGLFMTATVPSATSSYLAAHRANTTGIWVIGGGMAAAVKAEQQLGVDPHSMPVAGLCIPSDVRAAIQAGLIENCVLWSPADTAYADVYAIDAYIKGRFPKGTGTLDAGRLGRLAVSGGVVSVGKPVTFTVDNIDKFQF